MFKYSSYVKGAVEYIKNTIHDQYMRDRAERPEPIQDWMVECDGILMSKQLVELIKDIRAASGSAMRGPLKLMCLYRNGNRINRYFQDEVGLYREGDTFLLGVVGYSMEFSKYYVTSPDITNDKYNVSHPMHHAVQSSGKERVVQAFKKYCAPVSSVQHVLAGTIGSCCESEMSKAYRVLKQELGEMAEKLVYSSKVLNELWNVHRGASINPEIVKSMEQYFSLKAEVDAEYSRTINLVGIMFSRLPSGITMTKFGNFGKYKCSTTHDWQEAHITRSDEDRRTFTTMEELPEEVMGKVSVLSMVDDNNYIKNVGFKYAPTLFIIELDENVERAMRVGCTL